MKEMVSGGSNGEISDVLSVCRIYWNVGWIIWNKLDLSDPVTVASLGFLEVFLKELLDLSSHELI